MKFVAAVLVWVTIFTAGEPVATAGSPAGGVPGSNAPAASVAPVAIEKPVVAPTEARRFFAIAAVGGVAAPTGLVGIEAAFRPARIVELAVGVGAGVSGLQGSAMLRAVDVNGLGDSFRGVDIVAGVGVSYGHYDDEFVCIWEPCDSEKGDFTWLNGEIGVQAARPSGLFARLAVGLGSAVKKDNLVVTEGHAGYSNRLPYLAFTVGYGF